jgi:8-oxo-dGTP pyrophosphatase MutT (NUDIX family)
VKEETGLSIVVKHPISVFEYVVETSNEIQDTTQINFFCYLGDPSQQVKIDKKYRAARWFSKEELLSLQNISEETRKCAIKALEV